EGDRLERGGTKVPWTEIRGSRASAAEEEVFSASVLHSSSFAADGSRATDKTTSPSVAQEKIGIAGISRRQQRLASTEHVSGDILFSRRL
ncbi:hypothetical protein L9F63_008406, partial [Diploptera punctata]